MDIVRKIFDRPGYVGIKIQEKRNNPIEKPILETTLFERNAIEKTKPAIMNGVTRQWVLIQSPLHICTNNIPEGIVERRVWGGNLILAMLIFEHLAGTRDV